LSRGVVQSHNIAVRAGHLQHVGIRVMHSVRSWAVWVYHRADDGWVLGELLVRVRVRGGLDQRNRGAVSRGQVQQRRCWDLHSMWCGSVWVDGRADELLLHSSMSCGHIW